MPACMTSCASSDIRKRLAAIDTCAFWRERCGVELATLHEAARELAQSAETEP